MEEIWKDIPGYEGLYQASNLGRIKSLDRILLNKGKYPYVRKGKIHYVSSDFYGYKVISLTKNINRKIYKVHQLVAMAFLGHNPNGYKSVINHINFIKTDNRVLNLEIVTPRENCNKKHINSTSKYVGVFYDKERNKWQSKIKIKGKSYFLGRFNDEYDAHLAYQKALKKLNITNYQSPII